MFFMACKGCFFKFYRSYSTTNRDSSAVLVVSPLIPLMMDQVHSLCERSVDATVISSGVKVSNNCNVHLVLQ